MLADYRSVFKNRDYRNLWFGQTLSVLGDRIYEVAFYWLAYQSTSSPFQAGLVVFCASAPYLLFGLVGGVYADRLDRRKVMIVGDVIRCLAALIVPILSLMGSLPILVVAMVAFVLTSVRCFFYPASKAALADILTDEQRQLGSSFLQASFQSALVAGAALGGVMVGLFSAPLVYFTPVVTYAISILFLLPIKSMPPSAPPDMPQGLVAEITDTVRYIWPIRELFWSITLFGLVLLAIAGIDRIALPALSDQTWHVGSVGLGLILGVFAIGNIVCSLIIGRMKINRFAVMIFGGFAVWGAFYAMIGATPYLAVAVCFAFLAGAGEAMHDVPMVLLIQERVPRERMGKVFSMWSTVAFIGEAGSALVSGLIVGALGPGPAYIAAGCGLILVALLGLYLTRSAPRAAVVGATS